MKLTRLPTARGSDWWIIVHELTLAEGRLRKLRHIHVFTHLAHNIVEDQDAPKIAELC